VPLEAIAGAAWTDLVLLRRSLERLEQLVEEVPGLGPVRDGVRISYHFRRGEFARAAELGELYVQAHAPRQLVGWSATYGVIALSWLELGHTERAFQLCERALAQVSPEDRSYFVMYGPLEVAYAMALAIRGEVGHAKEIMRVRTESLRAHGEHASLVLHYQYQARLARYVGDRDAYQEALQLMRDAALASGLPTVILLADRVAELRSRRRSSPLPPAKSVTDEELRESKEAVVEETAVTAFLHRRHSGKKRSQAALWFLARYVCSEEAYLYRTRSEGLQLMAAVPERAQTPELESVLAAYLGGTRQEGLVVVPDASSFEESAVKSFRVMILAVHGHADEWTGIVAIRQGSETVQEVPDGMLADITRVLSEDIRAEASSRMR
jgi:hypothetical protein